MEAILILLAVLAGVLGLFVLIQFNQLVGLRQYIRNAWSNVDTELQRRYNLIPNLVETVKGYASHERETLEQVIAWRTRCQANHGSPETQAQEERQLVGSLQRLLAIAEAYPNLKADQHFLQLQEELIQTEDRIQAARRFYNGNVRDYTTKCESFPSNLVAQVFGFKPEEYFQVEPSVREAPQIHLS